LGSVTAKSIASTFGSAVTVVSFRRSAGLRLLRPEFETTQRAPASVARSGAWEVDQELPVEVLVDDELDEVVLTSWDVAAYSFCWRSENPNAAAVTITVTRSAIHLRLHTTPT
jgi:hypothetical protein